RNPAMSRSCRWPFPAAIRKPVTGYTGIRTPAIREACGTSRVNNNTAPGWFRRGIARLPLGSGSLDDFRAGVARAIVDDDGDVGRRVGERRDLGVRAETGAASHVDMEVAGPACAGTVIFDEIAEP